MEIYPLIARRLADDKSILDKALGVLDGWDAGGVGPVSRRRQWRALLISAKTGAEGLRALTELLLDPSEDARRARDFAPFAGVLSREERRTVFLSCTFDH